MTWVNSGAMHIVNHLHTHHSPLQGYRFAIITGCTETENTTYPVPEVVAWGDLSTTRVIQGKFPIYTIGSPFIGAATAHVSVAKSTCFRNC